MEGISKIALGGGCHWCTEAVFQSLKGVQHVAQGYVASTVDNTCFSEAVIISFNSEIIPLQTLIEIHLFTHKSTSDHSMRDKYRSAIYFFSEVQQKEVNAILQRLQLDFNDKLITKILPFSKFKPSRDEITNYYYKNPEKPFCRSFIEPKLKLLLSNYSEITDAEKIKIQ